MKIAEVLIISYKLSTYANKKLLELLDKHEANIIFKQSLRYWWVNSCIHYLHYYNNVNNMLPTKK